MRAEGDEHTGLLERKLILYRRVIYNDHQTMSLRADLPRLRPCCARPFASYSRNNFRAFPNSLLGSHVLFQRTLYSVPDLVSLLSRISVTSHSCSSTSAAPPWP